MESTQMSKPRIIVTSKMPDSVEDRLREQFLVSLNHDDEPFSPETMVQALQEADGILCTTSDRFDEQTLLANFQRRTKILSNFGVGVDHIDLTAAEQQKLTVTNTPGVVTDATADLAIALILSCTRRIPEFEMSLYNGDWAAGRMNVGLGIGIQGKTLGIVGMGRIGQATARRAHLGFGMNIIHYNHSEKQIRDFPSRACATIDELLTKSDIVSLHIPGGRRNAGLIGAREIRLMKPGAFLINTARGDIVDEAALTEALKQRTIAGAGLDVFANEPQISQDLLTLENTTLLPHIGTDTVETMDAMGMLAVDNLIAFFAGEPLPSRVV